MAGKSAAPLVIGLGAAALLLSGKKKKKTSSPTNPNVDIGYTEDGFMDPNAQGTKLVLDDECMSIAHKINPENHNNYITNRFNQMISEGLSDPSNITLQLLAEQSEHCPWKEPEKWTPMMKGLFSQLNAAVTAYYEEFTGAPSLPNG